MTLKRSPLECYLATPIRLLLYHVGGRGKWREPLTPNNCTLNLYSTGHRIRYIHLVSYRYQEQLLTTHQWRTPDNLSISCINLASDRTTLCKWSKKEQRTRTPHLAPVGWVSHKGCNGASYIHHRTLFCSLDRSSPHKAFDILRMQHSPVRLLGIPLN